MSIKSISLGRDNIYSMSYNATRVQNVASGYSLSVTGSNLGNITQLKCTGADGKVSILGSSKAIAMSKGRVETKSFVGESVVIVDPIVAALGKLIIFQPTPLKDETDMKPIDTERVKYMHFRDYEQSFKLLVHGNVKGFIQKVIGTLPIEIIYHESAITKALQNSAPAMASTLSVKNLEHIVSMKNPITVGELFSQIVSSFGLELYFMHGNTYSLEEPRIIQENPSSIGTIEREDIIEMSTRVNPYNIPDMIVPSFDVSDTFPLASVKQFQQQLLVAQMSNLSKQKGTGGFKVQTYQIPAILTPTIAAATSTRRKALGETKAKEISSRTHSAIEAYFQAFAYKSSFFGLDTGTVRTVFRPDINVPYSWYTIAGERYFISNISHNVSRNSAETVLSIAGVYDPNFKIPEAIKVEYLAKEEEKEDKIIDGLNQETGKDIKKTIDKKKKAVEKSIYKKKSNRKTKQNNQDRTAVSRSNMMNIANIRRGDN